jgi:glycosyltransferase involved in cell wall biosynthesis
MRILYVTQVSLDGSTGGTRHVHGITRGLAALGHDVDLVAPRARRRRRRAGAPRPTRAGLWLEARHGLMVSRLVARRRPDVACVRIGSSTAIVPRVLEVAGVPTLLELNGPVLDELEGDGGPVVREVVRGLLSRVVRRSGPLLVPLASFGDYARARLGAQRVEVIENGCDLAIAVPAPRVRARRALGLDHDRPCVAFTGTLGGEQRIDLLLAAAELPDVQLLVAGDGPGSSRVAAAAAELPRLRYFGSVAHERAVEIVRAADVALDLSPFHVGMKGLEYAALGRRIVAFDAPGAGRLRRLYPEHEVLFGLRDGTPDEMRGAVTTAIAAEAADPLPPAAVAMARRGLGWDSTAKRLAHLLESRLLAGGAAIATSAPAAR